MPELLLELFSEEIPARMQAAAAEQLRTELVDRLADLNVEALRTDAFATPRRLTVVMDGLPSRQPDSVEVRKGPHVGAPQAALEGFMKSAGLSSLDGAEVRTVGSADYYFVNRTIGRRSSRTGWPRSQPQKG